jgi:hypothetical protein
VKHFLALAFIYGTPFVWGYLGGSFWVPLIGAIYLATEMVISGWRQGSYGEAGVVKSLLVGTVFSGLPCLGAYFLGRWLSLAVAT